VVLGYAAIWPEALVGETAGTASLTVQMMTALLKHAGPAGLIVCLALLVPVIEELLFRGVLLQAFAKHIPFAWANVAQAMLFALAHENLRLFPFYTAFGVLCGLLARRSGGLLPPVAVHLGNNLIACLVLIVAQ
jgi:membrane protease YdiL (CAAX protease family)